ncbi:MAG: hypothetical protein AMJ61_09795 [Desulfobacterales bacterium SG8_35_2]|nr:MAG: hypothetical protein AMJ61_09795 [Desulfobacterales bacterium SG8_35_2]
MRILFYFLLLILLCPGLMTGSVSAMETEGIETQISAGLGVENLLYEERLSELALESNSDVTNLVVRVEGLKTWENIFIGINGIVPLKNFDKREEWFVHGMLDQTNLLNNAAFQFAAFIGYPFNPLLNPFMGLKSIWSNQQRSDFRSHEGTLISSSTITEEVIAHFAQLGVRGSVSISEKWGIGYGAEYNFPYYSKVTNDGFSGWEATNIKGYAWFTQIELLYAFRENISMSLFLCAGRQHWEGSDWQVYDDGQIKWPENDTYIIHSIWDIIWKF